MFTVALCDDDELVSRRLKNIINGWSHECDTPVEIHSYQTGEALLEEWNTTRFDLIFLDIDMPGKNGIDTARQIRKLDVDTIIVFLTGYDSYAISGYEVQAYRYILKPISDLDLHRILSDARQIVKRRRTEYITLNMDGSFIKLAIKDILYIESFDHTTNLVTRFSTIKYSRGLSFVENELSGLGFLRCHRSFLVNMKHIFGLRADNFITLSNGQIIPVSRNRLKQVKTAVLHQPV